MTRKVHFLMAFCLFCLPFMVLGQQLTQNTFTGTGACPTQGNTFSSVANATIAPMSRQTTTCTATNDVFNSTTLNNTAAPNDNSYLEFSITANAGFSLNLTKLDFIRRGSNTAPNKFIVAYSTDISNFNNGRVNRAEATTTNANVSDSWTFSAPITTAEGGKVTFRLYPYGTGRADAGAGASATTGTFRLDDVTLFGTIQAANNPTLKVNPTSITGLNYNEGAGPSTPQSYTLTGSNLTNDVTVTAPTDFEIATTAGGVYGNSLTVTQVSGSVNQNIFVRLVAGKTAGNYNGNVSNVSTGATTQNVAVSGTVVNAALPDLTINNVTLNEGNSGTTNFTFTISLSAPAPAGGVTYDIATANNTATSGTDYTAQTLTGQTIAAGMSSATFTVAVNGDATNEPDETFFVNVTNVTNANVTDGQGEGTITNDDVASGVTLISAIQGSGTTAALTGSRTIEGIVTRVFPNMNGFYIQEEDADSDGNAATSEGLFVFVGAAPTVAQGDKVRVAGTVAEFTSSASGNTSSLTQMTAPTITPISASNPLPTVTNVTLPVANKSDLEAFEAMLVNVSGSTSPLTVSEYFQLGRFGQLVLAVAGGTSDQPSTDPRLDQFTQFNAPSVSGYSAFLADIEKRRIFLDDANTAQNPDPIIFGRGGNPLTASNTLRGGDQVTSITSVLDERFEGYRIQTNQGINFQATNARPTTPTNLGAGLIVGNFNVLNYFNGPSFPTSRGASTAAELERQEDKMFQAIINSGADVLGLNELEDDANSSIQSLVNGLNGIVGAGTYAFINAGDISDDEITVGIIYKPSKVTPINTTAAIPFTFGQGSFDVVNRRSLAQTFRDVATNGEFTIVTNHFKSKGSSSGGAGDTDVNDGQGNSNGTRTRQAQDLRDWLATNPTASTDPKYLIVGDLNAYAMEDPLTTLATAGYNAVLPNTSYSYVFNGQIGSLDHILASSNLTSKITGSTKWHINSDEPPVLDYNVEFKTVGQQSSLYAADQYRTSDHDPILVSIDFNTLDVGVTAITAPSSACTLGSTESITVTVKNFATTALPINTVIPVQYQVGSGTVVSQDFTLTTALAADATRNFTFTTTANLGTDGTTYSIIAQTNLVGDIVSANNAFTKSVTNFTNTTVANAGDDQTANSTTFMVLGNTPAVGETSTWAKVSSNLGVVSTATVMQTGNNATVNNVQQFEIVTLSYTINPAMGSTCGTTSDQMTVERNTVLATEIIHFEAIKQNETVVLNWEIGNEERNTLYSIERSENSDFSHSKTLTTQKGWNFTDKNPLTTTAYYRLKVQEANGKTLYSQAVAIKTSSPKTGYIHLYPNPAMEELNINYDSQTKNQGNIRIFDAVGQLILTQNTTVEQGDNQLSININTLPTGTYFVQLPFIQSKTLAFVKK